MAYGSDQIKRHLGSLSTHTSSRDISLYDLFLRIIIMKISLKVMSCYSLLLSHNSGCHGGDGIVAKRHHVLSE